MNVHPTGLRGRLLASVAAGLCVLLAILTLAFNVVLARRLDGDARGVAQARAAAGLGSLTVSGGRIRLPESPDERSRDTQLWVFQAGSALERPQAGPAANDSAATALAHAAPAAGDVEGTHTRLYAMPVVQSGRRLGAVVAGVSLRPYEQTRHTALVASIVLAAAVFLAVVLTAGWLISKALGPVARMTQQAADWSEHDLDRRFSLGPPRDELTQLAATLDGLLDRLSASLRHEQRLSAELSHELRTPLASIAADAQYALRHTELSDDARASFEGVLAAADRMARTLDTLMAAARGQLDPHGATSDGAACARAALEAFREAEPNGPSLSSRSASADVRVAVEQDLVERMLAPLIENAVRHAEGSVEVSVTREGSSVVFTVGDDGAGVASDELEAIFEPGRRAPGSATATVSAGAGLGLALARRLARSAGGEVWATRNAGGGRFAVRLPAA
jgi:two-component system OmpR family sensor kinase